MSDSDETKKTEWKVRIVGDWRDQDGKPVPYDPAKGIVHELYFSGSVGFHYFAQRRWRDSIAAWEAELAAISSAEWDHDIELHKGWIYFRLAQAYSALAQEYMARAQAEDKRTYGNLADQFPAARYPENEQ